MSEHITASSPHSSDILVLLVEDDALNTMTMTHALELYGYRIIHASDGIEAFEMARKNYPDIIFMDIQIPKMDGLEVIRRVKAEATLRDIPIIALTAFVLPDEKEMCLEAGADAYLSKPVRWGYLISIINNHIMKKT